MAIIGGNNLNSVPAPQQQTFATNYLDLSSASNAGWGQQYLPDLMEKKLRFSDLEQFLVS